MTLTTLAIKMQYDIKKEQKMFSQKNCKCDLFSVVFVIKLGGMTEIFSTQDRQGHESRIEFIIMQY